MTVIDIHTHMLSTDWLGLILEHGPPDFAVERGPDGNPWIFESGLAELPTSPEMFDYEARIDAMNKAGIDVSVLSLTAPNVYWGGAQWSNAAARAINDNMAAAQTQYPDRIRFFASLPWQYPDLAAAELDRVIDLGAAGVTVLANIRGMELTDLQFASVWGTLNEKQLAVLVHPSQPQGVREKNPVLKGSVCFPFDTTLAIGAMALDGFFDRYPDLKVIASHAGGALPYLAGRIDQFCVVQPPEQRKIIEPPSSYFRRIHFDAITYDMDALQMLVEFAGPERVMFGTDYPHPTDVAGILRRVNQLKGHQSRGVLGRNAERLLGL